jgi:dTDP-N-acetylfucosamine:lipid II N-acetylfucosaminyltransferase
MKNLHLFPNEKFTEPYIEFINKNFSPEEHLFLVIGKDNKFKISERDNVKFLTKRMESLVLLIKSMYRCEKIFLHGLFIRQVVYLLFLQPWLLKKSYWIVWGGDLYWYKFRERTFKSNLYEWIRRFVIGNIGSLITLTPGDFDLAKKWYGVKGRYYHGAYINPMKLEFLDAVKNLNKKSKGCVNIQIGNSADPSNRHIEVLDLLIKFRNEDIKLFLPLSYGDRDYAKKVVKHGEKLYGEKINFLLEFMTPKEYAEYLATIDIAIFANQRQQGLGNIYAFAYLGKKIYIRSDVSTWDYLKDNLRLDIYNYLDINTFNFMDFVVPCDFKRNKENIMKVIDEENLIKVWNEIF